MIGHYSSKFGTLRTTQLWEPPGSLRPPSENRLENLLIINNSSTHFPILLKFGKLYQTGLWIQGAGLTIKVKNNSCMRDRGATSSGNATLTATSSSWY